MLYKSPTWLTTEPDLGTAWALEYAMACLGSNCAIAGALALQYRMGLADGEIAILRRQAATKKRSVTSG